MIEDTIFMKIVKGEIPCSKVYEDEDHLAFLDIAPFVKGHTLVIPKKPYENVTDMPESEYLELQKVVLKLTKHYREIFNVKIGNLVYGLDVSHVHVHIFPLTSELEVFRFGNTKSYLGNEMETCREKLKL